MLEALLTERTGTAHVTAGAPGSCDLARRCCSLSSHQPGAPHTAAAAASPPARRGFCQCRPRRPPERGRGRRDRIQPEPALHLTHRSDSFRERRMCWRWFSEGQPRAPGRRPLPPTRWLRLPQGGRGPCPPGSPAVCANHGGGHRRVGRAAGGRPHLRRAASFPNDTE